MLFRLAPLNSRPVLGGAGTCAACMKPVASADSTVRIYGELFHHGCAYYRSRDRSSSRKGAHK